MSALIPADETWPYTARYGEAAGFRQHYVDEGPQHPEHTLVSLHSEPTWGYEWRHLIGPLSRRNRVIVPDHTGFGKSATPPDRTYPIGWPGSLPPNTVLPSAWTASTSSWPPI